MEESPNPVQAIIAHVLERTPQWVRHDLVSKDRVIQQRAEETLAAMIANALQSDSHKEGNKA